MERGKERHLVLDAGAVKAAQEWLDETHGLWEQQLDSLEAYIAGLQAPVDPGTDREAETP